MCGEQAYNKSKIGTLMQLVNDLEDTCDKPGLQTKWICAKYENRFQIQFALRVSHVGFLYN